MYSAGCVCVVMVTLVGVWSRTTGDITEVSLDLNEQSSNSTKNSNSSLLHRHKVVPVPHHKLPGKKRVEHVRKPSAWRKIANMFLGDDDDSSSSDSSVQDSSDSVSDADSGSMVHPTKRPPWKAMASSLLAQMSYSLLKRMGRKRRFGKKKNTRKYRLQQPFHISTPFPLKPVKSVKETPMDEGVAIHEGAAMDTGAAMETGAALDGVGGAAMGTGMALQEGIFDEGPPEDMAAQNEGDANDHMKPDPAPEEQVIYKMNKGNLLRNPLHSLAELKREVEDSGRRLSFIEYAALVEIVVLTFIAVGVFRTAALTVPLPVFSKV